MNKFVKSLKYIDMPLLIFTFACFTLGLLTIVTASSRAAVVNYDVSIYYYFYRQLSFIIIGLIFTFFILHFDTKYYKILFPFIYIFMIILNIIALKSDAIGGSNNWINLGFTKLQPSEFSKPVLILSLACLFEMYYRRLRTKKYPHNGMIITILFFSALIPMIVFLQKDLGTFLIMFFIIFIMYIASPIQKIEKFKYGVIIFITLLLGLLVYTAASGEILNSARKSRFTSWLNPCGQYETGGYQVCNSYIAINDGGLTGLGIGKSKQKYSYIPEPHTDSAFAIITEEYGVLVCTIIFLAYVVILWRILNIASKSTTIRGRYICLGVASYIFAHIFINMGGLFGVIPLTGVPLPFFSYGGSFAISLLIAIALVQKINIETRTAKVKIK